MPFTFESSLSWLYLSILSLHCPFVILTLIYILTPYENHLFLLYINPFIVISPKPLYYDFLAKSI